MNAEKIKSEALEVIFKRRSCRSFLSEPIPQDHLDLLVEAMQFAPSAGNRQPWHFYLISNPQIKNQLVTASFNQRFIADAPVIFAVCAIPEKSGSRYGERGSTLYVYQDTAAAVENLMLAATSLGYGSCWIGAFDEKQVRQVLNLPDGQRPVAMVPVGKPARIPSHAQRIKKEEFLTVIK